MKISLWRPGEDAEWLGCRRRAQALFGATSVISHEDDARRLGDFLWARLTEQDNLTPLGEAQRDALASIVRSNYQIATYLSCGDRHIKLALAHLLRLALPYADHPDYRPEWAPLDYGQQP